jgi:hypothetical protein
MYSPFFIIIIIIIIINTIIAGMASGHHVIKDKEGHEKESTCPINELWRHGLYVAGILGIVGIINARKH